MPRSKIWDSELTLVVGSRPALRATNEDSQIHTGSRSKVPTPCAVVVFSFTYQHRRVNQSLDCRIGEPKNLKQYLTLLPDVQQHPIL